MSAARQEKRPYLKETSTLPKAEPDTTINSNGTKSEKSIDKLLNQAAMSA